MNKNKLTHITDAETITAIERNDYGCPIPASKTDQGYWVYTWSLEEYREKWKLTL